MGHPISLFELNSNAKKVPTKKKKIKPNNKIVVYVPHSIQFEYWRTSSSTYEEWMFAGELFLKECNFLFHHDEALIFSPTFFLGDKKFYPQLSSSSSSSESPPLAIHHIFFIHFTSQTTIPLLCGLVDKWRISDQSFVFSVNTDDDENVYA